MAWSTPLAGRPWDAVFTAASIAHGLPAGLLSRVAWQESHYDPQAYNASSGAAGMMQFIPRWHPGVDPWEPLDAIPYAAQYLRGLRDRFGSWALALAAYNAGPLRVEEYGGIPPFPETQRYVAEILADAGLAGSSILPGLVAAAAALFLVLR